MENTTLRGVVASLTTPFLLSLAFGMLLGIGCTRAPLTLEYPNDLEYSQDTVRFDSVFVGRTSPTRLLAIYNRTDQPIRIPRIALEKGPASPYVVLVDGDMGPEVKELSIFAHDSLLVFMRFRSSEVMNDTVTECTDLLAIESRNGSKRIPLKAWTLNASVLELEKLTEDLTLDGPPARVLKGSLSVPEGLTLTLRNGASLYFPPRAGLHVRGTLRLEGTGGRPVVLAPDRLDQYYRTQHGLWGGVVLYPESGKHVFKHAVIRNAATAIAVEDYANKPLRLEHSQLLYYALDGLSLKNTSAQLFACIIAQGARSALRMRNASVSVLQSTLYSVLPKLQVRRGPLLSLEQLKSEDRNTLTFDNSILWGDRDEEFALPKVDKYSGNITFSNSVVKVSAKDTTFASMWSVIRIDDPLLTNPQMGKFYLQDESPARGLANPLLLPSNARDLGRLPYLFVSPLGERADAGALAYSEERAKSTLRKPVGN